MAACVMCGRGLSDWTPRARPMMEKAENEGKIGRVREGLHLDELYSCLLSAVQEWWDPWGD